MLPVRAVLRLQTLAVLNPLKHANTEIMQDTDLAGPLVFCLAFGGSLLLVSRQLRSDYDKAGFESFCASCSNVDSAPGTNSYTLATVIPQFTVCTFAVCAV